MQFVIDWTAVATFVLAGVTALSVTVLGILTYRMAKATREVATHTAAAAKAAVDQTSVAREELRQLQEDAKAAAHPVVGCELRAREYEPIGARLAVELRLVNLGGHAEIVDRLNVTGGPPGVQTKPPDVFGLLPQGLPRDFQVWFDIGLTPEPYQISIQFKTKGTRFGEVESHLYHLTVERWTDAHRFGTFYRAELTPSRTPM